MTNSGSADETESEMRTRKTRQTACSRKRIWKARARQKTPRIVFEADLWKMLKNSTPWVWLEWIEFFSFFQHFSAFWKLMNAHFSKNSCCSRYSIINEWPHWKLVHRFYIPKRNKDIYRAFNFSLKVEKWTKNLQERCFTLPDLVWRSKTFFVDRN